MENQKRTTIGAWKKMTSKGQVISFTIEGKKYSMWENTYKKTERQPDFNIVEDKQIQNNAQSKPVSMLQQLRNQIDLRESNDEGTELPF